MEAECIRTLRLRVKPLDEIIENHLKLQNDESILYLTTRSDNWAIRTTGLILAKNLLKKNQYTLSYSTCSQACLANIEHEESRTREETIELLHLLTKIDRETTWKLFGTCLKEIAWKSIGLDLEERGLEAERRGMKDTKQEEEEEENDDSSRSLLIENSLLPIELEMKRTKKYSTIQYAEFRGRVRANSSGASARIRLDSGAIVLMVHETVGWKALETSLKGLDGIMKGYGEDFVKGNNEGCLTTDLINLFHKVLDHESRFVREVGFEIVGTLASLCKGKECKFRCVVVCVTQPADTEIKKKKLDTDEKIREELYHSAAEGMCDSFSQVRFKSCVAARCLIQTFTENEKVFLDTILGPSICLNRHYAAEGIRSYSQENWKLAFSTGNGPEVICNNIEDYFDLFLSEMISSKDDLARNACCLVIGEVYDRLKEKIVSYDTLSVLRSLHSRLMDASWTVRSSTCTTCATIIKVIPEKCHEFVKSALKPSLIECLSDPVWSVREDAAISLGDISQVYVEQFVEMKKICQELLQKVSLISREQLSHRNHHHHSGHSHGKNHENQVMFSCCSADANDISLLSLKKEDWQYADGGIRLFRELARVNPTQVDELMNELMKIIELEYDELEETIWKSLIPIAQSFGKRPFKRHLDDILPYLIKSLSKSQNQVLQAHAAALTCKFLREWIGENIFRARVESLSQAYWQVVESNSPQSFERNAISFRG